MRWRLALLPSSAIMHSFQRCGISAPRIERKRSSGANTAAHYTTNRLAGRSNLLKDTLVYNIASRPVVGNFPQVFSHVGLINIASNLTRAVGPAADGRQP